jgi:glucosamine 6-phosphate synthetase-like amidotransferase/phosphosugar isomerase protein
VALVEHDYSALLVDVGGRSSQAATEIASAVRAGGGQPVLLRAAQNAPPTDMPNVSVSVPVAEPYAPIVVLALGQLLALELAKALGLDAARPRGLRKVTSTR